MILIWIVLYASFHPLAWFVSGHADYLTTSYCGRSLSVGTNIMGYSAVSSSSKSVIVSRSGVALSSGDAYVAGETLTISLSNPGIHMNMYVLCLPTLSHDTVNAIIQFIQQIRGVRCAFYERYNHLVTSQLLSYLLTFGQCRKQ